MPVRFKAFKDRHTRDKNIMDRYNITPESTKEEMIANIKTQAYHEYGVLLDKMREDISKENPNIDDVIKKYNRELIEARSKLNDPNHIVSEMAKILLVSAKPYLSVEETKKVKKSLLKAAANHINYININIENPTDSINDAKVLLTESKEKVGTELKKRLSDELEVDKQVNINSIDEINQQKDQLFQDLKKDLFSEISKEIQSKLSTTPNMTAEDIQGIISDKSNSFYEEKKDKLIELATLRAKTGQGTKELVNTIDKLEKRLNDIRPKEGDKAGIRDSRKIKKIEKELKSKNQELKKDLDSIEKDVMNEIDGFRNLQFNELTAKIDSIQKSKDNWKDKINEQETLINQVKDYYSGNSFDGDLNKILETENFNERKELIDKHFPIVDNNVEGQSLIFDILSSKRVIKDFEKEVKDLNKALDELKINLEFSSKEGTFTQKVTAEPQPSPSEQSISATTSEHSQQTKPPISEPSEVEASQTAQRPQEDRFTEADIEVFESIAGDEADELKELNDLLGSMRPEDAPAASLATAHEDSDDELNNLNDDVLSNPDAGDSPSEPQEVSAPQGDAPAAPNSNESDLNVTQYIGPDYEGLQTQEEAEAFIERVQQFRKPKSAKEEIYNVIGEKLKSSLQEPYNREDFIQAVNLNFTAYENETLARNNFDNAVETFNKFEKESDVRFSEESKQMEFAPEESPEKLKTTEETSLETKEEDLGRSQGEYAKAMFTDQDDLDQYILYLESSINAFEHDIKKRYEGKDNLKQFEKNAMESENEQLTKLNSFLEDAKKVSNSQDENRFQSIETLIQDTLSENKNKNFHEALKKATNLYKLPPIEMSSVDPSDTVTVYVALTVGMSGKTPEEKEQNRHDKVKSYFALNNNLNEVLSLGKAGEERYQISVADDFLTAREWAEQAKEDSRNEIVIEKVKTLEDAAPDFSVVQITLPRAFIQDGVIDTRATTYFEHQNSFESPIEVNRISMLNEPTEEELEQYLAYDLKAYIEAHRDEYATKEHKEDLLHRLSNSAQLASSFNIIASSLNIKERAEITKVINSNIKDKTLSNQLVSSLPSKKRALLNSIKELMNFQVKRLSKFKKNHFPAGPSMQDTHLSASAPASPSTQDTHLSASAPAGPSIQDTHLSASAPASPSMQDPHLSASAPASPSIQDTHLSASAPASPQDEIKDDELLQQSLKEADDALDELDAAIKTPIQDTHSSESTIPESDLELFEEELDADRVSQAAPATSAAQDIQQQNSLDALSNLGTRNTVQTNALVGELVQTIDNMDVPQESIDSVVKAINEVSLLEQELPNSLNSAQKELFNQTFQKAHEAIRTQLGVALDMKGYDPDLVSQAAAPRMSKNDIPAEAKSDTLDPSQDPHSPESIIPESDLELFEEELNKVAREVSGEPITPAEDVDYDQMLEDLAREMADDLKKEHETSPTDAPPPRGTPTSHYIPLPDAPPPRETASSHYIPLPGAQPVAASPTSARELLEKYAENCPQSKNLIAHMTDEQLENQRQKLGSLIYAEKQCIKPSEAAKATFSPESWKKQFNNQLNDINNELLSSTTEPKSPKALTVQAQNRANEAMPPKPEAPASDAPAPPQRSNNAKPK